MYLCSTRIEEKIHHIMRGHLSFEEEYRAVVENYIRIADKISLLSASVSL